MSSVPAGTIIWIACRPLIRLLLGVGCGFLLTKADIFPPVAARGAGQIALNITLPCLLFSNIIPAFSLDNLKALGPLVLVAFLYEVLGVVLAWVVKQFFWVPHRFRYGILIAGGWGNVGDLPTAVILSITGNPPFSGTKDQKLAVAYIAAFILVFMVTLFPFGFHRWLAWDYAGPDVEPEIRQQQIRDRRRRLLRFFRIPCSSSKSPDNSIDAPQDEIQVVDREKGVADAPADGPSGVPSPQRHVAFQDDVTTVAVSPSVTTEYDQIDVVIAEKSSTPRATTNSANAAASETPTQTSQIQRNTISHYRRIVFTHLRSSVKAVFTPLSMSIFIAFPIALVPQLKALFVKVPNVDMPSAPDGLPPLDFLLDTTSFIGAASIPIGLICLGSSLARLNVPLSQWRKLPLGAISWLAIAKIIIMPVLGVIICEGLLAANVIFKDDKVLLFVCMFFSCLPTATTQVYLTQIYSGTGESEHLAAFLVPQYILMFISMTALTAYALQAMF